MFASALTLSLALAAGLILTLGLGARGEPSAGSRTGRGLV